jgi:endoribonuclease Dicer
MDLLCSGYELGSCASDLVWRKALREMDANILPSYVDDDDDDEPDDPAVKATRIQEKVKNVVKNWIFTMPNLDYTSRGYNVTPKLVKLVQILQACAPQGDHFRGIVFGNTLIKSVRSHQLTACHALV